MGRGRHLSISTEQMQLLLSIDSRLYSDESEDLGEEELFAIDDELNQAMYSIEEGLSQEHYYDTDKAWDDIHRALTGDNSPDGRVTSVRAAGPLNLCFIGGRLLGYEDDERFLMTLIQPEQVKELAVALAAVTENHMRERFFSLDPNHTGYPIDENEFQAAYGNFRGLPPFFARAASEGRAVIFSATY